MRELLLDQQLWTAAAAANRVTAEGVHALLSILDGSEASLASATRTWLELMAAQALHKLPGAPFCEASLPCTTDLFYGQMFMPSDMCSQCPCERAQTTVL